MFLTLCDAQNSIIVIFCFLFLVQTYGVELNTLPTIFLKFVHRDFSINNSTFAAIKQFKSLRISNVWEQGDERTSCSIRNGVNS